MSALADEAHELSDRLGDDHDLAVLLAWAHEHAAALDGMTRIRLRGDGASGGAPSSRPRRSPTAPAWTPASPVCSSRASSAGGTFGTRCSRAASELTTGRRLSIAVRGQLHGGVHGGVILPGVLESPGQLVLGDAAASRTSTSGSPPLGVDGSQKISPARRPSAAPARPARPATRASRCPRRDDSTPQPPPPRANVFLRTLQDGVRSRCPPRRPGVRARGGGGCRVGHRANVPPGVKGRRRLPWPADWSRNRAAGALEVWAARAWNVFNEGRPFSIVYPAMVLLGRGAAGPGARTAWLGLALLGALGVAVVLSRFSSRCAAGRCSGWRPSPPVPLLEPWRAPALLLGALAGWVFFTVFFWGALYYHLRTGAPWTNFTRFWRLVATNSDPTSGNMLEQVPKMVMALSAATLLAEEPAVPRGAIAVTAGWRRAGLDGLATLRPQRAARLPARSAARGARRSARRVYVIVVDGANRGACGRPTRPRWTAWPARAPSTWTWTPPIPARTVVCFSSMLTAPTPAEHGMRSNFAPRLGVRAESVFDARARGQERPPGGHRPPAGPVRRGRGALGDLRPAHRADRPLADRRGARVVEDEDPDLLVLQLLAADQLGHVRGTRNHEYLEQMEQTDRQWATSWPSWASAASSTTPP